MPNAIAFFDFDKTMIEKNSLLDCTRYICSPFRFYLLFPVLLVTYPFFRLGIITDTTMKTVFATLFFKGLSVEKAMKKAHRYSENVIPGHIDSWHQKRLQYHKDMKHHVVVVSASFSLWIAPWSQSNGIDSISTELEQKNGVFTGKIIGRNCYAKEKVERILDTYCINTYRKIFAYSDSLTDAPLLAMADDAYLNRELIHLERTL